MGAHALLAPAFNMRRGNPQRTRSARTGFRQDCLLFRFRLPLIRRLRRGGRDQSQHQSRCGCTCSHKVFLSVQRRRYSPPAGCPGDGDCCTAESRCAFRPASSPCVTCCARLVGRLILPPFIGADPVVGSFVAPLSRVAHWKPRYGFQKTSPSCMWWFRRRGRNRVAGSNVGPRQQQCRSLNEIVTRRAGKHRHPRRDRTTGVAPGTPQRPTGPAIGRPNEPRAYGETNQGTRVNPDRAPSLAPGGQGETGNR